MQVDGFVPCRNKPKLGFFFPTHPTCHPSSFGCRPNILMIPHYCRRVAHKVRSEGTSLTSGRRVARAGCLWVREVLERSGGRLGGMASRNWAWVVLKREGVEGDEVATQVFCPGGRSFNVDALKDAAKAKFGQGLAHVDASQLSVSLSADRDGAASVARQSTLVETLGRGSTEEQPLFIHAPAAPPQVQDAEPIDWDDLCLASIAWLQSTLFSRTFKNHPSYMTHSSSSSLDTHAAPNSRYSSSFNGFDTISASCPREGEGLRQRRSQHLW
mmetsp:Transcript_30919/g.74620  ORF Transcript_30919/g.74620 Transcript_30919/m.74620 type:complete len:271 (+) Transcript_30919:134-946(+)